MCREEDYLDPGELEGISGGALGVDGVMFREPPGTRVRKKAVPVGGAIDLVALDGIVVTPMALSEEGQSLVFGSSSGPGQDDDVVLREPTDLDETRFYRTLTSVELLDEVYPPVDHSSRQKNVPMVSIGARRLAAAGVTIAVTATAAFITN